MKLPRSRATRLAALTVASLVAVGAGAVADTLSVNLLSVNGTRMLHLTGASLAGPATLSFNSTTALSAPFGVVVTDAAYARRGYDVEATLSNLYPLGADGNLACTADPVPSGAFALDPGSSVSTTDPAALVQSVLTFTDDDIVANVNDILGTGTLTGTIALTPAPVTGLLRELSETELDGLSLMTVTPGANVVTLTAPDAHPGCPAQAPAEGAPITAVPLQGAETATPDLSALATSALGTAAGGDAVLTPTEAIANEHLPANAVTPNEGDLWHATRQALVATLDSAVQLLLGSDGLDTLTTSVVADLEATSLVFDLVGQTGVYASVPSLDFAPDAAGDPKTGLYHGVMTVTLTDR